MVEHHIQKEIIDRLRKNNSLRYSELKPRDIEGNIFTYHLNLLINQKLINKNEGKYSLSPTGLSYVDKISSTNLKPRNQPKIIAILAIYNPDQNKWLLAKRKILPYFGQFMLPSGKIHLGESSLEHAKRELEEQITEKVLDLKLRGVANIRINQNKVLISHVLANIFYVETSILLKPKESDKFSYHWEEDLNKLNLMPGTAEVIEALNNKSDIFLDLEI